jgi:hypothetical protein
MEEDAADRGTGKSRQRRVRSIDRRRPDCPLFGGWV